MRVIHFTAVVLTYMSHIGLSTASDDQKTKDDDPCTVHSPHSGAFFDLNPISLYPIEAGKKAHKDQRNESWHARGYDYPANFTLNVCAPVLEELKHVEGVKESHWRNVSAYYEQDGKTFSIGQQSAKPIFRGRKMILQYTDGSPCPNTPHHKRSVDVEDLLGGRGLAPRKLNDGKDHDKDHDDDKKKSDSSSTRRKSTLISLLCERDALAPKATVAFVGASPDDCAYFFELRSPHACGGVSNKQQALGPGGVFGVIAFIALLVYLVGGCVYQRTVMHARGWRQLPNYGMWAGMGSFFKDMFIILTSSCARWLPRNRGYRSLSSSNGTARGGGGGGGRGSRNDDENRLIDQLDEDWDE
ncbi:MAG: hypothetical protein M1823_005429 [Watsoniomyces obsoletus]|nr:MAG: hypothetical protein M1823_005429 [Watsoniomyces obsoletus]